MKSIQIINADEKKTTLKKFWLLIKIKMLEHDIFHSKVEVALGSNEDAFIWRPSRDSRSHIYIG